MPRGNKSKLLIAKSSTAAHSAHLVPRFHDRSLTHHSASNTTKFGSEFGSNEANKWVVNKFKLEGGSFQVKLLEHWKNNLKHGLFEGFDAKSNKTFKDEYRMGLRIKHQTFDKSS